MNTSLHVSARIALAGAVLAPLALAQGGFATWAGYDTGTGSTARHPYDCATADFDHDGDADLAVVNWWSYPKLGVLLNQGDGSYAPPVLYPSVPSYGVVAADLDGDTWADIVVADHGQNGTLSTVSVYLNAQDGSFLPRRTFAAGRGPIGLAAADFDGDGDLDLAVANNRSTTVSLLRNNGRAEFAPPVGYLAAPTVFGVTHEPYALAAADLNGDGLPDLAVGNENQYVTVLLNQGNAVFGAPTSYDTELGANAGFYASIVVGDVDRDGDADVLYSNTQTQTLISFPTLMFAGAVAVFRNDGTGALASAEGFGLKGGNVGFADMVLADVTGDGWDDILGVWQADGGWGLARSDGAGGFRLATEYSGGDEPMAIAVADVDGDTDLDPIVVARESLMASVQRNPGNGDFSIPPVYPAGSLGNRNLDAADLDGDGDLDVASCWSNSTGGGVDVLFNSGRGELGRRASYPSSQAAVFLKLRDLNGDGAPDVVWADDTNDPPYNFKTRLNLGNGALGPQRTWNASTCGTSGLDAFDVDGDGDQDVVLCDRLFCGFTNYLYVALNNGNGTFAPAYRVVGDGLGMSDFAGGDFDNDGDMDLLSVTGIGLNFLANNGDGTFKTPIVTLVAGSTDRIAAADFDGDGNLDVAVTGRSQGPLDHGVHILLGFGDGGFNLPTHYTTSYSGSRYVVTGDVDGDGDPDVLVANISASDVSVLRNLGDGRMTPQVRYGTSGGPNDLTFADFTGDGVGDIAVVSSGSFGGAGLGAAGVQILPGLPYCDGFFVSYGTGLPGSGNRTPFHTGSGCPVPGGAIRVRASNALAGAPAAFVLGTAPAATPLLGGVVLAGGSLAAVPALLDGDGAAQLGFTIPSSAGVAGSVVYSQVVVADPGAERGVAFSGGLETHIE